MPGHQRQQQQVASTPSSSPTSSSTQPSSTSGSGAGNSARASRLTGNGGGYDQQELNNLFDAIDAAYDDLLGWRIRAVQRLGEDAEEVDPPPAWQSIALAVGTVALAAATAGVSTAVTGALAGGAKIAWSAIIKGTGTGAGLGLKAALGSGSGGADHDAAKAFFRSQVDALQTAKTYAQQEFITSGRAALQRSDDPIGRARELRAAILGQLNNAGEIQRQQTLASWCNFQARAQLGTDASNGGGVDLSEQLGDTSAKGVLGLEVTAPAGIGPVTVENAEIEGLNKGLRKELAARPIGQLGIAITVHGQVDPPAWYETRPPRGVIRFGENEAGTRWRRNDWGGDQWLMWKGIGGPVMTGPEGFHPDEGERKQYIWQGIAQVLDNEIKPRSLQSMHVDLDG